MKYKILIHGDDMCDKDYVNVIEIEAKNLQKAIEIANNQNGVYQAEPAEHYDRKINKMIKKEIKEFEKLKRKKRKKRLALVNVNPKRKPKHQLNQILVDEVTDRTFKKEVLEKV